MQTSVDILSDVCNATAQRTGLSGLVSGLLLALPMALGIVCAGPGLATAANDPAPPEDAGVVAWGTAFSFSIEGGYVGGGEVSILERPDLGVVIADDRGHFEFGGLTPGEEVTFFITAEGFHPTQTGTLTVGPDGLSDVTFQAPPDLMFNALSLWLRFLPSPSTCQVASTVVRKDASPYEVPHGLGGAVVTISPDGSYEEGPVYFQYVTDDLILPVYYLEESTQDGGVLFLNLEPGEYVLRADKEGEVFSEAKINCRRGVLVNASPPYGLQALPNVWE